MTSHDGTRRYSRRCRCAVKLACYSASFRKSRGGGFFPMKKLTMTLMAAALMAGLMAISASAQSVGSGAGGLHAQIQNATPIGKAACGGYGPYCPPGTTRVCGAY